MPTKTDRPAVSAVGWFRFLGLRTSQVLDRVSSQEPAEDGPTSFGRLRSLISTGPDRKREGNITKWPNFSRYTRQNHNCSPSAAKTLQKPVLHMKPSTLPHISVLLMFYYKKYFIFNPIRMHPPLPAPQFFYAVSFENVRFTESNTKPLQSKVNTFRAWVRTLRHQSPFALSA